MRYMTEVLHVLGISRAITIDRYGDIYKAEYLNNMIGEGRWKLVKV